MAKSISGKTYPDESIVFDSTRYTFSSGFDDITADLPVSEKKRLVSGFDVERDNRRLSDARRARAGQSQFGLDALSESTAAPLLENLVTDPFAAPIESLGAKADQFFGTGGIKKLLIFAAILLAGYIFIAGGWFKRR